MTREDREPPSRRALLKNSEGASGEEYDLGVLFVHGIGSQRRGEHLVQMGEALVRWLDRWIRAEETGPVTTLRYDRLRETEASVTSKTDEERLAKGARIRDARLTSDGGPARAVMEVGLPAAAGAARVDRWLLAESHWADEFLPPSFVDLCRWGLFTVPWTLAFHLGGRIRRLGRHIGKRRGLSASAITLLHVARVLVLLAALPVLATIAMVVILVLLLLALLPIPWLRSWLGAVQRALSGTMGDSLVLLESPIQAAAIIGRTARDISWVVNRCDRLAIVAHSQGAAVAHEALATGVLAGRAGRDHLLFTYGSGLAKLEALRAFRCDKPWWAGWLTPGAMLLGLVALIEGGWVGDGLLVRPPSFIFGGAVGLASVFFFWHGVRAAISASQLGKADALRLMPSRRFGIGLRWCDRWSSADPVPSGPLFDPDVCPSYLEDAEDVNLGSMWRDHTAYHRNFDGFLPGLARELASVARLDLVLREGDAARLRLGKYRRSFRVRALVAFRLITLVAVLVAPLALHEIGVSTPLGDWVLEWLGAFADSLPALAANLFQPVERLGKEGLGLVAVVLMVLGAYGIVTLLWVRLEWADEQAFFWRCPYEFGYRWHRWSLAAGLFVAVVVSVILAPVEVAPGQQAWTTSLFTGYLGFVFVRWCISAGLACAIGRLRPHQIPHGQLAFFRRDGDVSLLHQIAEATVWTYAATVAFALVVWLVLGGIGADDRVLTFSLVVLAFATCTGVEWVAQYAIPRFERLAALGEPEVALGELESEGERSPRFTGASPSRSAAPRPPGRG